MHISGKISVAVAFLGLLLLNLIRKAPFYSSIKRALFPIKIYRKNFSIGIFVGTSPTSFGPPANLKNPVLTAADVTDAPAVFVADPFLIQQGTAWYMFFEVYNRKSWNGEIAVARSSDGFRWEYEQLILSEPFHLSYPYVFEWENEYYMIPESGAAKGVRLYKADNFPTKWSYVQTLIPGTYLDASVFYYQQKWWIFAAEGNDSLYLFFADNLLGPWLPHPKNPIISGNPHISRPGGRVVVADGKIIRFAQDDYPEYGLKVHAFEVTELSMENYQEKMVKDSLGGPSGKGWNARGMHHICPVQISEQQWIACVDGWSRRIKVPIK